LTIAGAENLEDGDGVVLVTFLPKMEAEISYQQPQFQIIENEISKRACFFKRWSVGN
jgi:hypothetical protein